MKRSKARIVGITDTNDTSQDECQYASYYDDVPVADLSELKRKKNNTGKTLHICLIVFGLIISVAVCIAVMCLL